MLLCYSGESMTLSAVYGPCEVKPQKLLTENATVEVSYKPKTGLSSKHNNSKFEQVKE